MRAIRPYRTLAGAKRALDNGGRFYNLLSRADDEEVTAGELSRAAGVHSLGTEAFLFLDLALSELTEQDRTEVISLLEPRLRARYRAAAAPLIEPSQLDQHRKAGRSVMVEGQFGYQDEQEALTGLIMIPIGATGAMIPIPAYERYRLYSVSDSPEEEPSPVLVAAPKTSRDLAGLEVRLGGEFKEIELRVDGKAKKTLFLEGMYYTQL